MSRISKLLVVAGAALVAGAGGALAAGAADRQDEQKAFVNDVATELGVEPAKLQAAIQNAMSKRLDAAVASGALTQAEADRLKERLRQGGLPLVPPLRGGGLRGHHFLHGLDAAATYLGMTRAQLRTALTSGKTLAQVATDRGKSVDGLVDALVADAKTHLDRAVQSGRLTDAQRDELEARLPQHIRAIVNGERPALRHRGFGFRRFGP